MGERIFRALRVVRRPGSAGHGTGPMAGRADAPPRVVRRLGRRDDPRRYCVASGWQMRAGCTDGDGGVICPLCSRRVRTQPQAVVRYRVEVIEAHSA